MTKSLFGKNHLRAALSQAKVWRSKFPEQFLRTMSPAQIPISFRLKLAIAPFAIATSLLFPGQADALNLGYQDTSTQSFSTSGTNTTTVTTTFPGFNPALVPASHLSPVLVGFQYYFPTVNLSGVARIICDDVTTDPPFSCPLAGPFPATATLTFDTIINPTGPTVSAPAIAASIAGPAGTSFSNMAITGSATNIFTTNTALVPGSSYTNTPVTLDFYKTSWAYVGPAGVSTQFLGSPPTPDAFTAKVNGTFGIRYVYTYVPGPLPILGSAAAFGWSRRLRKRISQAA